MFARREDWLGLPSHLRLKVLQMTWDEGKPNHRIFQTLRLVSTAWRDAVKEDLSRYDSISIRIEGLEDLKRVCKLFTGLKALTIRSARYFYMEEAFSMSVCSQLISVSLHNQDAQHNRNPLSMMYFPPGLRELKIEGFELETASFHHIQCRQVKTFSYLWYHDIDYDIRPLFHRFTGLKVSKSYYTWQLLRKFNESLLIYCMPDA